MKTFTLEDNEAQFVIQVLGQMPTQSGAFPLFQKCADQFNAQNPSQDTPPSDPPQE
jgi:hypothetical protein